MSSSDFDRPARADRTDRGARSPVPPTEVKRTARHDAYAGPYDVSEAPVGQLRVDLGSLQIPSIEGVEVRVQANDGVIQQVVLAHGESALQLGAFAAPRTEGIWDEVRAEIRKSLFNDGVAAEESAGEFGVELRARVRAAEGMMDLRFIGIDGPRWMLRAVYQGEAAADPAAAGPLALCLRGLVVDRGRDAMPVRDALPLRLPREMAEQINAGQAATPPEAAPVVDAPVEPAATDDYATDDYATDDYASPPASGNIYGGSTTSVTGGPNGTGAIGSHPNGTSSNGNSATDNSGSSSNGVGTNAANGNGAYGGANGHSVHGGFGRGNPVDDTPMNGRSLGERAPGFASESDAAQRRRPSPRPRRPE